jgi:acyl-CoA synthetase (AMP-forming)/AMP-acid ligase II
MNVAEILRMHANQSPDQPALVDVFRGRARSTSFGELDQSAGRLAALLRSSGLRPGDTVLVFQRMSIELYVALAAIFRLGLTAMFVDPSAGRWYIDRCCRLRRPQGLIASSRAHLLRLTTPALRQIPLKFSIGTPVPGATGIERAAKCDCDDGIQSCLPDTAALASFTSGTTGEPKVALRTHGFLLAQHRAIAATLALEPREIELIALPIFVLANLASRVTSIIPHGDLRRPDSIDPAPLLSQIAAHGVTRAGASPALFERIVEYCERRALRLETLKKVFTGGGPVSLKLLDRLQNIAPNSRISVVYGSTEAEPISIVSLDEIESEDRIAMTDGRGLLVGRPIPAIHVQVLHDQWGSRLGQLNAAEFQQLCQPAGEPGEIVVSGEHVLAGYLDGKGDDENKLWIDGSCWHRTGDAGYLDEHGRLWLLGRCSARIDDKYGAFYPLGVEQTALKHEAIRRAAVVSVRGERVLAVELVDGFPGKPDLAALLKSLSFASVDAVRIVKRLPVDDRHNSKVDYPALSAILERSA